MHRGLDELIESLLTDIAFSGSRGCSAEDFIKAIDLFYGRNVPGPESSAGTTGVTGASHVARDEANSSDKNRVIKDASNHRLSLATKVWGWLVARNDVSVGPNRQYNHLSLAEFLHLCERERTSQATLNSEVAPDQEAPSGSGGSQPTEDSTLRLYVSEQRQWKALAGHGPDFKRIPFFEWRALVDIASVKEKGILQGDLVRLTGQDKRSLPTRTDALAKKGYIIKQPILLRGFRSSKLWLKQFAESAQAEAKREGLPLEELDLSKETLMKDLVPVPFADYWNGDRIDYLAIAQAFIAITKAWGIIRYCDLRTKMGVEERIPQMRALAKSSRWFTKLGAVTFVAARFANNSRLLKDCVKFLRDPTPSEWKRYRSIPTRQIKAPSSRLGKRGQASRDQAKSKANQATKGEDGEQTKTPAKSLEELSNQMVVTSASWIPQKPFVNTLFDVIKRAGPDGTSNNEVRFATLGYNYRKYIATTNASLSSSLAQTEQSEYRVTSKLTRVGKTMTYRFFASGSAGPQEGIMGEDQTESADLAKTMLPDVAKPSQEFSKPVASKFAADSSISFSELCKQSHPTKKSDVSRRQSGIQTGQSSKKKGPPKPRGRPPKNQGTSQGASHAEPVAADLSDIHEEPDSGRVKRRRGNTKSSRAFVDDALEDLTAEPPAKNSKGAPGKSRRLVLPDAPGVYRGIANSLGPDRRTGRPPKSIVLIFKSEKLKDPSFLGVTTKVTSEAIVLDEEREEKASGTPVPVPSTPAPAPALNEAASTVNSPDLPLKDTAMSKKGSRSKSKNKFECENCGKVWKNPNGLEYHINKSQTTCNPSYVEPPPQPKPPPVLFRAQKTRYSNRVDNTPSRRQSFRQSIDKVAQKGNAPRSSTHVRRGGPDIPLLGTPSKLGGAGNPIVLQDVEVHNVASQPRGRNANEVDQMVNATTKRARESQTLPQENSTSLIGPSTPPKSQDRSTPAGKSATTSTKEGIPQQSEIPQGDAKNGPLSNVGQNFQKRRRDSLDIFHPRSGDVEINSPRKRQKVSMGQGTQLSSDTLLEQPNITPGPNSPTAGPSALIVSDRNPMMPTAPKTPLPDSSLRPTPREEGSATAIFDEVSAATLPHQLPTLASGTLGEQYATPSKANSQTKITKAKGVSKIVQQLLSENNGVLPGDLALFILVVSSWDKYYGGSKPPDRRTMQFSINRLERQGKMKRLHFFFLDTQGESQKISIVVTATPDNSGAEELSKDPRVISMKESIREVYPDVYIPPGFSVSQENIDMHADLLSKPKEKVKQGQREPRPPESFPVHQIELLHYPQPTLEEMEAAGEDPTRGPIASDSYPLATNPSRKEVVGHAAPSSTSQSKSPKLRVIRRAQKKAPAYIWGGTRKAVSTWDQKVSLLQDTGTGAWSSMPHMPPSEGTLDNILSFVRYGRVVQTKRPGRKRKRPGSPLAPRKKVLIQDTGDVTEDDATDDSDALDSDQSMADESFMRDPTEAVGNSPRGSGLDGLYIEETDHPAMKETTSGDRLHESTDYSPQNTANFRFTQDNWSFLANDYLPKGNQPPSAKDLQTTKWFYRFNLPETVDEIANIPRRGQIKPGKWADKPLAEFVRRANAIMNWESSPDGANVILTKPVMPGSIFLDLSVQPSRANMQPLTLQWSSETQYTIDSLPADIREGSHDDQDAGLTDGGDNSKAQPTKTQRKRLQKRKDDKPKPERPHIASKSMDQVKPSYTTRDLTALPPSQQGRVAKRRPLNDLIGRLGDTAIIAAIVVIKSLLGGVEGTVDYGLLLKIFPEKSFTRLKSFWPKVCRQRKKFVDALTEKFQTQFLEAYESGEVAPIDFDNLEDYDWVSLILWAAKLETHEDIDLPKTRTKLDKMYVLEDPEDEVVDWRQTWFDNVAVHVRVEANISTPATIPLSNRKDGDDLNLRARSWVRSLCNTEMSGDGVPKKVLNKLLELGKGDEDETTRIISTAVNRLVQDKIATKGKSKKFGFRLNYNFDRIVDKAANTEKYIQAAAFKSRLDEAFRSDGEMLLPYAADDGSIMAVINMQSHGRIDLEPVDVPDIPFGFEPLNYESRSYPKSYYHWKVKLLPTETYLYDADMPLLEQVRRAAIPARGPHGMIPIWVDLLDRVDGRRWAEYVCMLAFALATKGPMTPRSASDVLRPVVEPFEARLVMDFLDRLGLLQRPFLADGATATATAEGGCAGEWWWLAVAKVVDARGNGPRVGVDMSKS